LNLSDAQRKRACNINARKRQLLLPSVISECIKDWLTVNCINQDLNHITQTGQLQLNFLLLTSVTNSQLERQNNESLFDLEKSSLSISDRKIVAIFCQKPRIESKRFYQIRG